MNDIRKSIFNTILEKCEKNKILKNISYFCVKSGIGDVIYRIGSKKYLKMRTEFYESNKERIINNIQILADEESKNTDVKEREDIFLKI